jgi:hypothetical protein
MNKNPLLGLESFGQSIWLEYVETLIGQQTVNTIPVETLNAFRK